MRILHIIQALQITGGTSVFVSEIAGALIRCGHRVGVIRNPVSEQIPISEACLQMPFSLYDISDFRPNIVHLHTVWYWKSILMAIIAKLSGVKVVWSAHGGLMPRVFQKGRIKKFIFWRFLLKPLLKKADAIHCTSEEEKKVCQKLGLPGSFIVLPLGVNLPELKPYSGVDAENEVGARVPSHPQKTVLFLGRLGEEKGLLNLLEAWKLLQDEGIIPCSTSNIQPPITKLIIAGPDWLGYKAKLDAKIAADHIGCVEFTGPVYGRAKDRLYRDADIFVLPSPMENFSMVILDALAYGVPAIATKGTPWQELESEHCGWWIDQGVEPLKNALREALATSTSDLKILGSNGRALAERKYQWSAVADKLLTCYKEILK